MKRVLLFFIFIFLVGMLFSENTYEPQAYIVYKQANEQYRIKKYEEARNYYLQLINQYPESRFVPYAIYMLSFIETDYVKIIDYLSILKDKYPEFQYWTNVVEKLADIFYIMDNQQAAIDMYSRINTDKSYYMLALIYSGNGKQVEAVEYVNKLLKQTQNNALAYKGFLILIKISLDRKKYAEAHSLIQEALKLKKYAYDNGARLLYYAGKCYFYRNDIENHYEKSLYIFSLLKSNFPLSVETSMANQFLDYLKKINIVRTDDVRWITEAYLSPAEPPYHSETISSIDRVEEKAENISTEAEGLNGNVVRSDLIEYVVRVGEFKDLSVANLVAADIVRSKQNFPLGIFYRNDIYVAEIRGIKNLNEAKEIAKKMMAMGYTETKVLEVVKVIEYTR